MHYFVTCLLSGTATKISHDEYHGKRSTIDKTKHKPSMPQPRIWHARITTDVLPAHVGRTSQKLQERIKQHVSRSIRNHHSSQDRSNLSRTCTKNSTSPIIAHDSAIGQHLFENPFCASQYSDGKFSILARGRTCFRLSALDATFIKSFQPNLCRHKEFLYSLKLIQKSFSYAND